MNEKKIKKIRKYARLRGNGAPGLSEDILRDIFEKSSAKSRKLFDKEMDEYFEAIKLGKVQPGESIILSVLSK